MNMRQRGGVRNGFLWVLGAFCAFALIYELAKEGLFSFGRRLTGTPMQSNPHKKLDLPGPGQHVQPEQSLPTVAPKPPRYEGAPANDVQVYASPPSPPATAPHFDSPPRYKGAPVRKAGNEFDN